MRIKKIGAVCLSAALVIGMLVIGNVLPAAATDEVQMFEANFAINKNGGGQAYIDNNTSGARDYLLSKFAFYRNQEGTYFERPLVNGYVADENGNSITTQNATQTTPAFAPDTGLAMDGDQYIDFTGNGQGPLAFWGLEWNYIYCTDRNDSTIDFYRNSNWMYVKDENGDLATLKNFRAEILFLPHNSTTQNTVAVTFRSATAGNVIASDETTGDRQLVSIDPKNGGLFFGNSFVRNSSSHSESLGGALAKEWYVLTVEVVEDTMTVTVKNNASGAVVYTTTKTLTVLDSGYLGIGGSMNGVAYKNIKITRLDKNGDAIDFNDTNDGWDFYANFNGLGTFRSDYHWLMGAESAVKGYYRDNGNTGFAWLEKVNTDNNFWFLTEVNAENTYDAQVLSYLNGKFDLNFEGQGWARSSGKPLETQFSGHSQTGTARLALFNGRFLNAVYSAQGTDGQNNIQKALGLRPLKADGTAWSVKNFETEFAVNLNTAQATSAVAFYFRAQNADSFASNASASAIVFSKNGYQLFDGAGPGNKYDYNAYTPWNGGVATAQFRVYVKVAGTALALKVTSADGKTVYADTTATITDGNAGYLYYTLINGNNAIGSVVMNEITTPVQADNTAVVDGNTITVKAGEGYQLKAGSLIVTDDNGVDYVPQRVGYRNGGDATQYEVVDENAAAPFTVKSAEFYQPGTETGYNMGLVGTSVHTDDSGLRFIHRLNIDKDGNMLYNGEKVKVTEYGLLLASGPILSNPEDLDIETANESMHVHQYAWPEQNLYYDKCDDHVDIAIHVKNIAVHNGQNTDLITRTYIILEDGTTVYGDVAVSTYNEAAGLA